MSGDTKNHIDEDLQAKQPHHPSFQRGVVFSGVGITVNIIFLFFETLIATRILDTDSFGVFIILVVVINFLMMVVDLGGKTTVTQLIASSEFPRQIKIAHSAIVFRAGLIIVLSFIILIARDLFTYIDPSRGILVWVLFIPFMLFVSSMDELLLAIHQGLHGFHRMAAAQILRGVLRFGLSITFLIVLQMGLVGLIYSWIISFAVSLVFLFLILPIPKHLSVRRSVLSEILTFGLPLYGNRVLWFLSSRIDVLLLSAFLGPSAAAYFDIAARIPNAIIQLQTSYVSVFFPTMTEFLSNGDKKQAGVLLNRSLRLLSFLMGLVAIISFLYREQIVTLLFSDKYLPSSDVFAILMIAMQMFVIINLQGYTLTSAGYPNRSLAQNLFRTIFSTAANLILIPILGVIGSAYASLSGNYITSAYIFRLLRRSDVIVSVLNIYKPVTVLLLFVFGIWWTHPHTAFFKIAFIILFILLNFLFRVVSIDDLRIMLSDSMIKRLGIIQKGYLNE